LGKCRRRNEKENKVRGIPKDPAFLMRGGQKNISCTEDS
jgi:hypothetical protein